MSDFTPKQYKKDVITMRIDTNKLKLIDKLANECDISRSLFINQCIDFAIENFHNKEKNE